MDNCKVCGTQMKNFGSYDSDYTGDEHFEYVRAYCPHCQKWYKWIEVFKFTSIENFEEDI